MMSKNSQRLIAFMSVLLIWFVISIVLDLPIIPSPLKVFKTLLIIFPSKISIHCLYSLWRILAGLALSIVAGIPIGLAMGYFDGLDKIISPFIYFIYPVPKIALMPIIMLLFGLGEMSKIIMITLIVIFQIIVAARDAVKDIPKETYYSYHSLGASRKDIFKDIVIPASLSGILTSTRVGLGTAISVLFFTETFGTEYGMGYFIMDSWMRINYLEMYSGIIVLSVMGFLLFLAVDKLEEKLCSWR